jgi:hypothetical protein
LLLELAIIIEVREIKFIETVMAMCFIRDQLFARQKGNEGLGPLQKVNFGLLLLWSSPLHGRDRHLSHLNEVKLPKVQP